MTSSLSIVMPVYNEGENISRVLQNLMPHIDFPPPLSGEGRGGGTEVLILYDFEEDNTIPVVKRFQERFPQVRLQRNDLGRGVLNALKKGFQVARAPYVLVMMADGSDEPEVIGEMLRLAREGADVVAGSRYMRGGGQEGGPWLKRTMSKFAGLSLHWVAGLPVHDATSNFRLYSRRLLDAITIESNAGFELAMELTVKAHRLGMRVAEVPTTWHDRTAGTSRFRLWHWLPHYLHWYWFGLGTRLGKGRQNQLVTR